MPGSTVNGIRISGLATVVPAGVVPVASVTEAGSELAKVIANTGVRFRRLAAPDVCASDLCAKAAELVLEGAGFPKDSIDLLVFISQTPDHILPATACVLHGRLGLAKHCAAFDVNLGCSGYVYGLSLAAAHLQSGLASRVLLLVGDTISKITSTEDRSVAYLFGDAGSATLLERDEQSEPWHFVTGTDGLGASHLQVEAGMFRKPSNHETRQPVSYGGGNIRSAEQLAMNGAEIFNFTLREVPGLVKTTLARAGWSMEEVDAVVLHQANRFILDYLTKRMNLPPAKVVLVLEQYGNTSSASIPLAICDRLRERIAGGRVKLLLVGFGVGFSWAGVTLQLDRPFVAPVTEL